MVRHLRASAGRAAHQTRPDKFPVFLNMVQAPVRHTQAAELKAIQQSAQDGNDQEARCRDHKAGKNERPSDQGPLTNETLKSKQEHRDRGPRGHPSDHNTAHIRL